MIEDVATYGARLARAAADAEYLVVEAARMSARVNRRVGKFAPLAARRIAQSVLLLDVTALRQPRTDDGVRAAVPVLVASRDHMSVRRSATVNALTALLRVTDLGINARRPLTGVPQLVGIFDGSAVADWRDSAIL